MSGLFGDGMATDDPPHGGITAQKVGVPIFIIVTRPTPTPVETSTSVSGGMAGIMAKAPTHIPVAISTTANGRPSVNGIMASCGTQLNMEPLEKCWLSSGMGSMYVRSG